LGNSPLYSHRARILNRQLPGESVKHAWLTFPAAREIYSSATI